MATPSHRLKLYRSDKHLEEMEDLIRHVRERREYPVIETMQPERKAPVWVYALDLSCVRVDEHFAIVLGDYLFNVRSALDHLAVGIAPRKRKSKASFPIFTSDPLRTNPASGDYVDAEAASAWISRTNGLPNDCIAHLKALQPYEMARLQGSNARSYPLAMLSAFQNADKHRELVPVVTGLSQAQVSYNATPESVVPVLNDGAILLRNRSKVDVKIEGAAVVGIRRGKTTWDFDQFTGNLHRFVCNEVLPRLEPFLK